MFWLLSRLDAHACFTNADGVRVKCECESNRFKHTFKTPFCRFDDEHEYTRVYMDNLYLSVRIAELARNPSMPWPKTLVAGPARTNRGIPDCCLQVREKNEKKAAEKKGTIKVATRGDLLCCSIYDNAPVHMLSTIDESVEMVQVKEYWSNGEKLAIFKLKLIDLYNKYMNSVDLADQLRNEYRPDAKWWRNKKWWWSIFLWLLGVVCTNAYLIMLKRCEEEGVPQAKVRSHKSFLEELATQLAASQPPKKKKRNSIVANAPAAKERKRRPQVSDQYLSRTKTVRSGDNHQISDTPDKQKADKAKCCWCRYLKLPPKDVMTAKISCDKCDSLLFCSAKHFNDFHKA